MHRGESSPLLNGQSIENGQSNGKVEDRERDSNGSDGLFNLNISPNNNKRLSSIFTSRDELNSVIIEDYTVPLPDELQDEEESIYESIIRPPKNAPVNRTKWETFKKRAPYYVPILSWLPKYSFNDLPHDFLAAVTVAIMLVPQSLSYAGLVGLPSVYGLYAGSLPLIIYAILGNSKQLATGPEALVSIVAGTALAALPVEEEPLTTEQLIAAGTLLSFLVGIFTFGLGLLRFGFLAEILSRPLVRGYVSAIGLTLIVEQLDALLGINVGNARTWRKIPIILKRFGEIQGLTVSFGVVTILFLVLFEYSKTKLPCHSQKYQTLIKIYRSFPGILIVVIVSIVLAKALNLPDILFIVYFITF